MAATRIHTFAGNIGIGTTDPGNYRLRVVGKADTTALEIGGVTNAEVKIGLIGLWYGTVASIPVGWALCNGQIVARSDGNGSIQTPNLVDRIVRCADGDAPSPASPGQFGGSNTVSLIESQMHPHNHPVQISAANAPHSHNGQAANCPHNHNTAGGGQHTHQLQGNNAQHSHVYVERGEELGDDHFVWAAENKRDLFYWSPKPLTNYSNAPHAHNLGSGGSGHNHPVSNNSNAPHNHSTQNSSATPHQHTTTVSEVGAGDAVDIKNKFIYLAYIMKI